MFASSNGHLSTVTALVGYGADFNKENEVRKYTWTYIHLDLLPSTIYLTRVYTLAYILTQILTHAYKYIHAPFTYIKM